VGTPQLGGTKKGGDPGRRAEGEEVDDGQRVGGRVRRVRRRDDGPPHAGEEGGVAHQGLAHMFYISIGVQVDLKIYRDFFIKR
jgi:hypothetical protein